LGGLATSEWSLWDLRRFPQTLPGPSCGFVATVVARRSRTPGFALIAAAILPLVPGLSLFTGLLQAVGTLGKPGDLAASGVTLLQALGVAVGIAAGATLGTYLGRPVKEQLRRIRNLPRPRPRSIREKSQQTGE
jgi:uncharacterized membrane protein YjjB (DUF3815 family)